MFPRLKGLGLIEAWLNRPNIPLLDGFPRLKGLGLIEASVYAALLDGRRGVSQAERLGPH